MKLPSALECEPSSGDREPGGASGKPRRQPRPWPERRGSVPEGKAVR